MKRLRFLHISDTHIGPDKSYKIAGTHPSDKIEHLINKVAELPFNFDFVIHTGDIVDIKKISAYEHAHSIFSKINKNIFFLPGNHDDSELVKKYLQTGKPKYLNREIDNSYQIENEDYFLFAIDAPASDGEPNRGFVRPETMALIRSKLSETGKKVLLFIHYPLLRLDSKWLDSGMLLYNGNELHEMFTEFSGKILAVFHGHVHRGMQVHKDNILYVSVGSTYCQLDTWPDAIKPQFVIDEPAYTNVVTLIEDQIIIRNHCFVK